MLTRTFLRPLPIQYDSPFVLCLWQRQVHCRQERVNLCQFITHIIMVKSDVSYIYCFPCHAVFRSTFVLCYSNIVLNIQTPNTSGHWSLDPWLIDYGGVSWLAFNMWTLTSLASKCQYDWEPVSRLCGQVQLDQKVLTIVVDDLDVGEIAFQIIPSPARAMIS